MIRLEDIPADVWEMARELLGEPDIVTRPKNIERAARALLAYGQSRADEATERAARVADEAAREALDEQKDPSNSVKETWMWACVEREAQQIATAIRSSKSGTAT